VEIRFLKNPELCSFFGQIGVTAHACVLRLRACAVLLCRWGVTGSQLRMASSISGAALRVRSLSMRNAAPLMEDAVSQLRMRN